MLEIHVQQRIVVRELEVTRPNQGIRIDTDNLLRKQVFRLTKRANNRRIANLVIGIYPEGIYTCCSSGRISTGSHIEFITLRQRFVHIYPTITVVQVIRIKTTIGIIHRRQSVHYVLFLALPRYFLAPIDAEVLFVEVFILRLNSIIRHSGSNQVGERDRITNPVHELVVLVVGDLCFVHPESVNSNHYYIIRLLKHSRLSIGSHHKATLLDKQHSIRISLLKVSRLANSYKLTGRFVATRQYQRQSDDRQNLTHFHTYKYLIDLYLFVLLGFRISNP